MDSLNTQEIISQLTSIVVNFGPKLIGAIVVWKVGGWIIKAFVKSFDKILEKRGTDESLKPYLMGIVNSLLKILLAITVLGMVGVEMTSFIAILGAAGLAVGLALSGTLQNFAGGVVLLIFKPFKVGDFIEAQGFSGVVSEIMMFSTVLKTPDNKTVVIPNGGLSTGSLINYTTEERRRVDWTIGIAYGDDVNKAQQVIQELCDADSRILPDPKVMIAVAALADSSVNFTVRAWVKTEDYWGVFFHMNKRVYEVFGTHGLNIPFPQMDVHVHNTK